MGLFVNEVARSQGSQTSFLSQEKLLNFGSKHKAEQMQAELNTGTAKGSSFPDPKSSCEALKLVHSLTHTDPFKKNYLAHVLVSLTSWIKCSK